ncbi:DNA repair protein rhp54 [Hordeum vulgare]|nr:DNA repair protein rhp54 [Hordeum vulgare]
MLGLNPNQHGPVNADVAAASTGSSAFPRMVLPDSPRASACTPMPDFYVYPHASRLSGECSSEVSVVAPSTPAPTPIDLNATPVAGGSSSGGARKRVWPMARNLFDEMPAAGDEDYMQNLIFEGGAPAAGYNPDETQSRYIIMPSDIYAYWGIAQPQVGMDVDGFPLDHEFPDDYEQEDEDECDIEGEPLFEDELANQAAWAKQPKRKSKRTKAYTVAEDKLLCECWRDIGQDGSIRSIDVPGAFKAAPEQYSVEDDPSVSTRSSSKAGHRVEVAPVE